MQDIWGQVVKILKNQAEIFGPLLHGETFSVWE